MNKTLMIVAVVVLLLVGFMYFSGTPKQGYTPPVETGGTQTQEPQATGNVDDAAAAILKDIENDIPPAAETDTTLTAENDAALDSFAQALDGSQF